MSKDRPSEVTSISISRVHTTNFPHAGPVPVPNGPFTVFVNIQARERDTTVRVRCCVVLPDGTAKSFSDASNVILLGPAQDHPVQISLNTSGPDADWPDATDEALLSAHLVEAAGQAVCPPVGGI